MRRPKRRDVKKWLLICFPFGLYLMWKRSCRWPMALKAGLTALFACAVLAIIIVPAPERQAGTQVKLVGAEPNAEVFGPEMPAGYNISDYIVAEGGMDLIAPEVVDDAVYVYVSASKGSTYYHDSQCQYAYASSPRVTLYEAHVLGYTTPCGICNPPLYDPATDTVSENPGVTLGALPGALPLDPA